MAISWLGTSMPTMFLPGTGASMRMVLAARASARSSASAVILLTFTLVILPPRCTKPGSTPNCVMAGPRFTSITLPSTPKACSVSSMIRAFSRRSSSLSAPSSPLSRISSTWGHSHGCCRPMMCGNSGPVGEASGAAAAVAGGCSHRLRHRLIAQHARGRRVRPHPRRDRITRRRQDRLSQAAQTQERPWARPCRHCRSIGRR